MDRTERIRQKIEQKLSQYEKDYKELARCEVWATAKEIEQRIKELKDVLFILDSMQEEPVSERFTFKAIPRLLEMIEPTDRAKTYTAKLADTLDAEGYSTDAKIVRESLKIMNGEKVAMTTMDEKPVNEGLEEAAYKYGKDTFVNECMENGVCDNNDLADAFKAGAKWQKAKDQETVELAEDHAMLAGMEKMKEQMMANAIDCEVGWYDGPFLEYTQEKEDDALAKINAGVGDRVKMIILKDE